MVSVNRRLLPAVYKRVIYRETGLIMGDMTLPACPAQDQITDCYRLESYLSMPQYGGPWPLVEAQKPL